MKKAILIFTAGITVLVALFALLLVYLTLQREQAAVEIEKESPTAGITRLGNIGSTSRLEMERFRTAFPAVYQDVVIGRAIRLAAN